MNKNGPIIIIEDDKDDQELFAHAFKKLDYPNEVRFFSDGLSALGYLGKSDQQPFLILSDINLPKLDGFKLREKIHNNEQLKLKCIPYLFFTTSANHEHVVEAYSQSIQGFFTKPSNYPDLERVLGIIVEYWRDCHSPNIA